MRKMYEYKVTLLGFNDNHVENFVWAYNIGEAIDIIEEDIISIEKTGKSRQVATEFLVQYKFISDMMHTKETTFTANNISTVYEVMMKNYDNKIEILSIKDIGLV